MNRVVLLMILVSEVFACSEGICPTLELCRVLRYWNKSNYVYQATTIGRIIDLNLRNCMSDQKLPTISDTVMFLYPTLGNGTECTDSIWKRIPDSAMDLPMVLRRDTMIKGDLSKVDTIYPLVFSMCPYRIDLDLRRSLVFEGPEIRKVSLPSNYVDTLEYLLKNYDKTETLCDSIRRVQKVLDELDDELPVLDEFFE